MVWEKFIKIAKKAIIFKKNKQLFNIKLLVILHLLKISIEKARNKNSIIIKFFTNLYIIIVKILNKKNKTQYSPK